MTNKSFEVNINPILIRWARETLGYTIEEIAIRIKASPTAYWKIETGEKVVTLKQLEKLAYYFKRPIATFFLPEPPQEPTINASFRILPNEDYIISKELRFAIRQARYMQSLANELKKDLNEDVLPKIQIAALTDDPIISAREERERMKIDIEQQFLWQNAYQAFNSWRDAIERLNILVFQFNIPVANARGFSLLDSNPPVIAVSSKDNILARIFTLFHEYAHIVLQLPEIYADEKELIGDNINRVESWCNKFASEFLMPHNRLKEDDDFLAFMQSKKTISRLLPSLSKKFRVSKHAILTRMRTLNLITEEEYEAEIASLQNVVKILSKQKAYNSPAKRCIQEKGKAFTNMVLQSKERKLITLNDAIDYLSIQVKHIDRTTQLAAK